MATFTIGSGGDFATITEALALGSVVPGDTLALLSGYNTETASVGIENLTFSGDASNTGIALTLSTGIMAITLIGSAPIAVTGNGSANSITGNDGSNVLFGSLGNDSINGGAGADTIHYVVGEGYYAVGTGGSPAVGAFPADAQPPGPPPPPEPFPGDGIDIIDGGADHDTLRLSGTQQYFDDWGKGYGGDNYLNVVVVDGAITSIAGGTVANVESVMLDLGEGEYWPDVDALDDADTTEAVTVNLATGTATGFESIAGVNNVGGGSGNDVLIGDAMPNVLAGGAGLDTLIGGGGANRLDGGADDDWLVGGDVDGTAGDGDQDILTGGLGADTFGFFFTADSVVEAPDVITDWESSDIIDLAGIDADTSVGGNQDFTFLGLGAADLTVGQGQLKYYHSGGNTFLVGNATADNQADFQIQINGLHNLTADQILGLAQFPANIDLSSLDGTTGFKLSGAADRSGVSVASAGDVNGDGFADLIVGALAAYPYGNASGASYVVFGQASGFAANVDLSTLDGTTGFKLSGAAAYDYSGFSVASAGDVNGDGFADLIVGALAADPHGSASGASYVVFGQASGFAANIDLSTLDGTTGFQLSGAAAYDLSGFSVASAGDVNGDGFADLIVGGPLADPHGSYSGASYVVFGKASGFAANIDLSTLDGTAGFKLSGAAAYDRSGSSVASAGDVNGDGFADLIVGAPNADPHGGNSGASYVVFGQASGFAANVDLSTLDGTTGFKLSGAAAGDVSGVSVASAGDVNGDGFADLIVGGPLADPNGSYSGASYVVFGQASGFAANIDLSTLDGTIGFKLSGAAAYDHSGFSVASAGDVNGDGFADLIVGARYADPHGGASGASYVVFGQASGFAANIDLSSLDGTTGFKLSGAAAYDYSGRSVASAGDVNGDGFADLIVGAPGGYAYPYGNASSASYVVFGRLPDAAVNRTGTAAAQTLAGGDFNDTLSGLGGDDVLHGNGGDDTLDGGAGDDTMIGGAGDDVYIVDSVNDTVLEAASDTVVVPVPTGNPVVAAANGGSDEIRTALASYSLAGIANVENLTGTAASGQTLTGNELDNVIDGGGGADAMAGGAGDDTYMVDHGGDVVIESAGEGTDTVFSTAHLVLPANVENLTLSGGADLQGYGNSDANTLSGNAGSNLLDGRGGADAMLGGAGNDVYVVDDPGDQVIENAGEGRDAVFSTAHLVLPANVEILVLQGSVDLQGYGNGDANKLYGNAGSNLLDGRGGADVMRGGAGNDVCFVDDAGDLVVENVNEGTDAVFSTVGYSLTANVEALVLQGSGNLAGTGNGLANKLYGNAGDNALDGGAGVDVLTGNAGNDTFMFNVGQAGGDIVVDFAGNGAAAGDSLQFVGYGAGATFTKNENDATHWQVNYNGGTSHEVITFMNGASIDPTDVLFS